MPSAREFAEDQGAAVIGGAFGLAGSKLEQKYAVRNAATANAFSKMMSDTAMVRRGEDLDNAGYNRMLAIGGPGAASPTGQMARTPEFTKNIFGGATTAMALSKLRREKNAIEAGTGADVSRGHMYDAQGDSAAATAAATRAGQPLRDLDAAFYSSATGKASYYLSKGLPHLRDAGLAVGGVALGATGLGRGAAVTAAGVRAVAKKAGLQFGRGARRAPAIGKGSQFYKGPPDPRNFMPPGTKITKGHQAYPALQRYLKWQKSHPGG